MRRPTSITPPPEHDARSGGLEEVPDEPADELSPADRLLQEGDQSTPDSRRFLALLKELAYFRSLRDPLASLCDDMRLTPTQVHALGWLGMDGPTQVGVLAQRIGITKKTITGVVDRLEDMGMVERGRDADDRRAVTAKLTDKGCELYKLIHLMTDSGVRRLMGLLEPEDRESLFGIIERMLTRLKGASPAR
ncbi:winged helix-turn-helix transcriptional regulator [Corallococcus sp. ZKHCc1 1396]|uniref:Winged helix-turn-helix transcriptional regulator n=1 Tax=Corallococcus soli TaxID=2710757 RepID=A0ABR9PVM5_9BACT|nr:MULTISPECIES: MarR family winged helix-turn-helix transcriptional regulator [Corallococcus]MBE4751980.1 winged helix-turn-helix transcriptional regulator [Corallococcus soli]MCY1034695.1 MarR family winged helix-turn-helix transcriptional regulator [Corallococcus sp. BB11-1]